MAVLALVLLAAPVGAAQAAWQSTAVPFAGEFGSGTLSAAPDGTFFASAAFGNPVKAYLSPRPPFGPFAAAVPYPAGGAVGAAMDFDAAGNAVMLSTAGAGTLATYRPAGAVSAFGPNQTLTAATAFAGLSVSPGGAALSAFAAYPGPSAGGLHHPGEPSGQSHLQRRVRHPRRTAVPGSRRRRDGGLQHV